MGSGVFPENILLIGFWEHPFLKEVLSGFWWVLVSSGQVWWVLVGSGEFWFDLMGSGGFFEPPFALMQPKIKYK